MRMQQIEVTKDVLTSAIQTLVALAQLDVPDKKRSTRLRSVVSADMKKAEKLVTSLKRTLRILYTFFSHSIFSVSPTQSEKKALKGCKTLMVLVQEATEALEKYVEVFLHTHGGAVQQTEEFKKLFALYGTRIEPLITRYKIHMLPTTKMMANSIVSSMEGLRQKNIQTMREIFDAIESDKDYELLLLKQKDRKKSLTDEVIKNIHVASHIDALFSSKKADPFIDQLSHAAREQMVYDVQELLHQLHTDINQLFHVAKRAADHSLLLQMYTACIALMMASVQGIHAHAVKGKDVDGYLQDFKTAILQYFDEEKQQPLLYEKMDVRSWERVLYRLSTHIATLLSLGLPLAKRAYEAFLPLVSQVHRGQEEIGDIATLADYLKKLYEEFSMQLVVRKKSLAAKRIEQFEKSGRAFFEPFVGNTFATVLGELHVHSKSMSLIRLPFPTRQLCMTEAISSKIFFTHLCQMKGKNKKSIFINLQHNELKNTARNRILNELEEEFSKNLEVISLYRDEDFYFQKGIYAKDISAYEFVRSLVSYFVGKGKLVAPSDEKKFRTLIETLLSTGCVKTSLEDRKVIIDIVTMIGVIKRIICVMPEQVFISCKDGIDETLPFTGSLAAFFFMRSGGFISKKDQDWFTFIEFGLPLLLRNRLIFAEPYSRFVNVVAVMTRLVRDIDARKREALCTTIDHFWDCEDVLLVTNR